MNENNSSGAGLLPAQSVNAPTMSSVEIAELTGKLHQHVRRDVETMCTALDVDASSFGHIYRDTRNREQEEYLLPKDLTLTLVSGYDVRLRKRIIDRWLELEGGRAGRPLSPAEMFLQNAQAMVAIERKQAAIESKVDKIEAAQTVLSHRPVNTEAITHIRKRIGKDFGLSAATIDHVMWQTPLGPKPAGMVKNDNPEADGATYAVYWRKDVTNTFKLFASQCEQATATMWTHPLVDGRFRMRATA